MDLSLLGFPILFERYSNDIFIRSFLSKLSILKHVRILTQIRNPPYLARNLPRCFSCAKAKLAP